MNYKEFQEDKISTTPRNNKSLKNALYVHLVSLEKNHFRRILARVFFSDAVTKDVIT